MESKFTGKTVKELVESFRKSLSGEEGARLWDEGSEETFETVYGGLLACWEDELYLQEFLPYGSIYRKVGEHAVRMRNRKTPIESVMQEHIVFRDVFWDYKRSRPEKEHDFAVEKRVCQCFNSILQATVQAYQTQEPTMDVLQSLRDELTGVFNSVYFMTRLEEEVKRSERYLRDVTVILFHVDSVFDPGSGEEEEILRAVARVLRRHSRASDILARVEENDFSMILPETRMTDAEVAAGRLKEQVEKYLDEIGEPYSDVNVEVGLASYPEHGEDSRILMQEAHESIVREEMRGD